MLNARGLKSKLIKQDNELALLDKSPHIIMVNETWFNISSLLYSVISQNYDVFRKNMNCNRPFGDVMI